jgi:hypothetical protein
MTEKNEKNLKDNEGVLHRLSYCITNKIREQFTIKKFVTPKNHPLSIHSGKPIGKTGTHAIPMLHHSP